MKNKIKAPIDEKHICSDWIYEQLCDDTAIEYEDCKMIAVLDKIPVVIKYYDNVLEISRADKTIDFKYLQSIVEFRLDDIFGMQDRWANDTLSYVISHDNGVIYVKFYIEYEE